MLSHLKKIKKYKMGNNYCKKCFTRENEKTSEIVVGNSQEIKTKPNTNLEIKEILETEPKIEINSETLNNSNNNNNNEYKNQNIQLNQNILNFYENSNSNNDENYANFDEDSSFLNDVNSRMLSKKILPIENKEKSHEQNENEQNEKEVNEEQNNEEGKEVKSVKPP